MVSLVLALGCTPEPPPRLPATRDTFKLDNAIRDLSRDEVAVLRPALERWARVGARDVRTEGYITDNVGLAALWMLQTEPAAIPTVAAALGGRNDYKAATVLLELGEPGCVALAAAPRPETSAAYLRLIVDGKCAAQLAASEAARAAPR